MKNFYRFPSEFAVETFSKTTANTETNNEGVLSALNILLLVDFMLNWILKSRISEVMTANTEV